MTPKKKAKELVDNYYIICQEYTEELQCSIQAKQCALIAVDEIIKSQKCCNECQMEGSIEMAYWQEVKQEIKKL
jgi:hypothetical protein